MQLKTFLIQVISRRNSYQYHLSITVTSVDPEDACPIGYQNFHPVNTVQDVLIFSFGIQCTSLGTEKF